MTRSPTVGGAGPSGYNIDFTKADPVQPYQSTIQGTLDVSEASSRLKEQLSSIASFMGDLARSLRADSGPASILELKRRTLPEHASFSKDGSTTVIAIPINGGSLELRVPPKEGIAEKLGSLLGITDQAQPATCSIKNERGEIVFQVALQEPTAITKFGQYKDVRFDENLTTWVGRSAATETWMAHAFGKYPELLTDTSMWPTETLPTEEIQRLSKALAVVSSGLSKDQQEPIELPSMAITRPGSVAVTGFDDQTRELGQLTKAVTDLLAQRDGPGKLAVRYPLASVDRRSNSITLKTEDGSKITISGPTPVGIFGAFGRYLATVMGVEPPLRKCVVTSPLGEHLKLILNPDNTARLVSCAGMSNLTTEAGVLKGADMALQQSHARLAIAGMNSIDGANLLSMFKLRDMESLEVPTRPLGIKEFNHATSILQQTTQALRA